MTTPTAGMVPASALRVSHAEREPVVERLQQAYAEGRLDNSELDLRLHLAMSAKTQGDLAAVLSDLTPAPQHRTGTKPRPELPDPTAEQRLLAALAHLLGIVTLFV